MDPKADYEPDFTKGSLFKRLTHPDLRHELLYKALGIKHYPQPRVFDITAGWGKDASIIAALGCDVILFERNEVVWSRLKNAIEKALQEPILNPIFSRMSLKFGCALELMQQPQAFAPDIIYCDPMFCESSTALPKKDAQALQALVTEPQNPAELVKQALKITTSRVVVKRAKHSKPYLPNPSFTVTAKAHCFDIFMKDNYHEPKL